MQLSKAQLREIWESDRKRDRRQYLILFLVLAAVFIFAMCFRYNSAYYDEKFVPLFNLKGLFARFSWLYDYFIAKGDLAVPYKEWLEIKDLAAESAAAIAQLKVMGMALISGAAVTIAGAVFQTAYKNPMASPNIIGATAGVGLGNVLVVWLFSELAVEHIMLRYGFCYGFSIICVAATLLLGKLAGDKRENVSVMEMVMVGSIVGQILNVFMMYMMYNLEDEDLLIYQELQMGTTTYIDAASTIIFFSVMAISVIPVVMMRYKLNVIGMDKMESTSIGIDVRPMRLLGQICGAIMVTCAMIHFGQVGMLSMVVPYLVRNVVGADFGKVCIYSGVIGGAIMVICKLFSTMFLLADEFLPAAFIMNLILMPAFLVILAKQGGRKINA